MKTIFLYTSKKQNEKVIEITNEILKNKGIVVLPTDTVYGIMTSVFNFEGQNS